MAAGARSLVAEDSFTEQFKKIQGSQRRADELLEGCDAHLANYPERGTRCGEDCDVWAWASVPDAVDVVPVVIYYTFNEQRVHLLAVRPR